MKKTNGANPKVPAGLKRCRKCGHFKGKCIQDGKEWGITCNCNLNICDRCNTPVHEHRIGTNEYNEQAGLCWHVGVICAWSHKCPDGFRRQSENAFLIDPHTGKDLLAGAKERGRKNAKKIT